MLMYLLCPWRACARTANEPGGQAGCPRGARASATDLPAARAGAATPARRASWLAWPLARARL
eukprot:15474411-Alexandrium_andersonii.AAC.1